MYPGEVIEKPENKESEETEGGGGGSGSGSDDDGPAAVAALLVDLGLTAFAASLARLGVNELADLDAVDDDDLAAVTRMSGADVGRLRAALAARPSRGGPLGPDGPSPGTAAAEDADLDADGDDILVDFDGDGTCPSRCRRALFPLECGAFHSYDPDAHACEVLSV